MEGELYLNKAIYSHTGCSSEDLLHAFRRKDVVILFLTFFSGGTGWRSGWIQQLPNLDRKKEPRPVPGRLGNLD